MMNWNEYRQNHDITKKKNYRNVPNYARRVTHRLSFYVVYACYRLKLSPNQVTLLSVILGVLSSILFICPAPSSVFLAALMLECYYVMDAVDGQLSRLTHQYSKTGAFFDVFGNFVIPPLVLIGIGVGQYFAYKNLIWIILGILASMGAIWLSVIWEIRGKIIAESKLPKPQTDGLVESASCTKQPASVLKKLFMAIHKLCVFPSMMNVITIFSIFTFISNSRSGLNLLIIFYALAIPMVSISKITKMILSREIDHACESC